MFQQNNAKRVNNQTHGFLKLTKECVHFITLENSRIKKLKENQILEKWEQERKNLDCGTSQSPNPVKCGAKIDSDSMLMMQPPQEKKIKMENEEPLEKVIKIENDINEKVKIEIEEEEKAVPNGELKEVKSEPIDEDEFEVKIPLLEQKIMPKQKPIKYAEQKKYKRTCSVCFGLEDYYLVEHVPMSTDRVIILLGMVLDGRLSVDDAKCQYTARMKTYLCRRHFYESRRYIFDVLGVKNAENICNAKTESIRECLEIVQSILGTPMTVVQFKQVMIMFVEKYCPTIVEKPKAYLPKPLEAKVRERCQPRKSKHFGICCYCRKSCEQSELLRVPKKGDILLKWFKILGIEFARNVRWANYPFICRSHFSPDSFDASGQMLKGSLPCVNDAQLQRKTNK